MAADQAPRLADLPRYPAIGGTCLIALGIYAIATPEQVAPLGLDLRAFWAEPWRLLTSALVHGSQLRSERPIEGLAHVGFNCYWMWQLGAVIEQRLGHLRTLGLIVLLAVGGSLLEYAFTGPAVGLSGVVYGFAMFLWVLGRAKARPHEINRWRGLLDRKTAQFFVGWFGFCVVATITDVMPIANFAHAGGAVFGGLVALAMTQRERKRTGAIAATVATLGLFVAAATVARPWVNISAHAGYDAMGQAELAMQNGDVEAAIVWAERGVGYWRTPAQHYMYLGWLYAKGGRYAEARDALAVAVERDPDTAEFQSMLEYYKVLAELTDLTER